MIAPAAAQPQPVLAPAHHYYTTEQIKIAALQCAYNAQAQFAHLAHLLTTDPTADITSVFTLLEDAARIAQNVLTAAKKLHCGE